MVNPTVQDFLNQIGARCEVPAPVSDRVTAVIGDDPIVASYALDTWTADEDGMLHKYQAVAMTDERLLSFTWFEEAPHGDLDDEADDVLEEDDEELAELRRMVNGDVADPESPVLFLSTRTLALTTIADVRTTQRHTRNTAGETVLASVQFLVLSSTLNTLGFEAFGCDDEECDVIHGYSGSAMQDAMALRADRSEHSVEEMTGLVEFGVAVERALAARRAATLSAADAALLTSIANLLRDKL